MSKEALNILDDVLGGKPTFGETIASLRKCGELTQVELAKKLGVSKQYLCDIENNRKSVSVDKAIKIAQALGQSKRLLVELALQEMLNKNHLNYSISLA
ncbi:helix-turn-helix transcriptional regulator [Francisella sp. LA112445]|jgi:transcriptional regulator with XRE-family HTH domain|uniref:helix-turn-helix transcriptional regulator n=1 Tax=Francisella sp. LA112445 TaxID=1395624 RepID=UPI001788E603|nr:helix-turn-helix transcriptional regulator [Francisella sp. LA112445]QIW09169.1 helix-turn-helix transcriptional regulator [Francisella sp. LA112445]